jgi:hypothetical protein
MSKRKKRNVVTLVSLLFILVVLIVAYICFSRHKEKLASEENSSENTIDLAKAASEDISSLHYKAKDADLTLVLKDKTWVSKDNEKRPINQDNVNAMINLLSNVSAKQIVNEKSDSLNDYGLDNPSAYLQAALKDKSKLTIQIGNEAVGTNGYYALVNEDGKVYLLDTSYGTGLTYSDTDMTGIEKTPSIVSDNILHIKVDNRNGEDFDLEYDPGNTLDYSNSNMYAWVISKPYDEKITADSNKVSDLLPNYASFSLQDCVDYEGMDLEAYGLKDQSASIYVKYYEEEETKGDTSKDTDSSQKAEKAKKRVEKEYKIYVGNKDEDGNYYVKTQDSNAVYTMNADSIDKMLNVEVFDIINPFISIPNINIVDKIKVDIDGADYIMEIKRKSVTNKKGKEETETAYYYNGKTVEEDAFKSLYQSLVAAKYDAKIKKQKAVKKEKPYMTITYYLSGAKKTRLTASYLPYDDSFYMVDTGNTIRFFADKRSIDEIADAVTTFKTEK